MRFISSINLQVSCPFKYIILIIDFAVQVGDGAREGPFMADVHLLQ
jgi:hypothetical protein